MHKFSVRDALIALIMAVFLWSIVSGREQVEVLLNVPLEFKGKPEQFIIKDGLVNSILVRVAGKSSSLRPLSESNAVYAVDLSGIHEGTNVLPFVRDKFAGLRDNEVLEITPRALTLEIEAVKNKEIPFHFYVGNQVPSELQVVSVQIIPPLAVVSGPTSVVDQMTQIELLYEFPQGLIAGSFTFVPQINLPDWAKINQRRVQVTLELAPKEGNVAQPDRLANDSIVNDIIVHDSLIIDQSPLMRE